MPVWQQEYAEIRRNGAELLSVAVDMQGPDKPRRYHDAAGAEFATVVDGANRLADIFGFKAVPNGLLIDEQGRLVYRLFGGFDIRRPEVAAAVRRFVATGKADAGPDDGRARPVAAKANDHFRRGLELLRAGDRDAALAVWREGAALEPDNWVLRKQLWALEHPERFYDGKVDYAWQKEQIARGR